MIVGNHDHPVSFGKASALDIYPYLSGDIHLFRQPDFRVIETRSGPLQFIALPWPIRSMLLTREEYRSKTPTDIRTFIEEKYVDFVKLTAQELDPLLPTVLAAHLSVHGAELSGSEQTSLIAHEPKFSVGQLAVPPIDYIALGHIHRYQDRNEGHAPPVVYSGSIECISFKEWDQPKGFVMVDIDSSETGKKTSYRFVETPARPFIAVEINAQASDAPMEAIEAEINRHSIDEAIVRVRYRVDESRATEIDISRIREALRPAHAIASIERVVDPVERQRRTVVTRDSTLEEAMEQYIAQHESLIPLQENLIKKALELESEYNMLRQGNP
jgi:exonuclease SbcD